MNGKYLLDTNIIIALFAAEGHVQNQINLAEEISTSIVTLGELYYGARKSAKSEENIQRINEFASASQILKCDQNTARQYGLIKNQLRAKGRPIPENDIWIAAQALQHQLTLVARDDHFLEIDELVHERW